MFFSHRAPCRVSQCLPVLSCRTLNICPRSCTLTRRSPDSSGSLSRVALDNPQQLTSHQGPTGRSRFSSSTPTPSSTLTLSRYFSPPLHKVCLSCSLCCLGLQGRVTQCKQSMCFAKMHTKETYRFFFLNELVQTECTDGTLKLHNRPHHARQADKRYAYSKARTILNVGTLRQCGTFRYLSISLTRANGPPGWSASCLLRQGNRLLVAVLRPGKGSRSLGRAARQRPKSFDD